MRVGIGGVASVLTGQSFSPRRQSQPPSFVVHRGRQMRSRDRSQVCARSWRLPCCCSRSRRRVKDGPASSRD